MLEESKDKEEQKTSCDSKLGQKTIPEMTPQEIAEALTDAPKEFVEKLMPMLQEMIGLVQLATAGDAEKVQDLIDKPGNFMQKLVQADQNALLGFLQAKSLWYTLQPTDPNKPLTHKEKLEWAKLLKDLAIYNEQKRLAGEKGPNIFEPGRTSGEVARYSNELIQEVVGDGEDAGSEGPGQADN